jgi:dienelactone hydrolase
METSRIQFNQTGTVLCSALSALLLFGCARSNAGESPNSMTDNAKPQTSCLGGQSPLPAPTGPYCVGGRDYQLIDSSREEIYTSEKGDSRELLVRVYYPTNSTAGQNALRYAIQNLPSTVPDLQTHTAANVPIASRKTAFPVTILSPGFGVNVELYASYAEELASHGFIVIAVGHPFFSGTIRLSTGKVIASTFQTTDDDAPTEVGREDLSFALSHFAAQPVDAPWATAADWSKAVAFGHSLGASIAFEMGSDDQRVVGVAALDGDPVADTLQKGLPVPFVGMQNARNFNEQTTGALCTHMDDPNEPWGRDMALDSCNFYRNLLAQAVPGSYLARFPKTDHMSFSDSPFVEGDASALATTQSIRALLLDFVKRRLSGSPEDNYTNFRGSYPAVNLRAYPKQ